MHGDDPRNPIEQGGASPATPLAKLATLVVAFMTLAGGTTASIVAQPAVAVRDSIVLKESGDDYLVLPAHVIPDGTGGYLVTDYQQPRILHYSGDGRVVQRYGRDGEGPGELKEASGAYPRGADHVLVLSWQPSVAQLFERGTGRFVERFPLSGYSESAVLDSTGLWMSGPDYGTNSAVRRLNLGDDEAEPVLRLPDEYKAGNPVGGIFPGMPFAKWADTLLVGFAPLPYLIVTDETGEELERLEVPAIHRRAAPADPEAAIVAVLAGGGYQAIFSHFSVATGVHRRTDGTFLLVHADYREEEPPVSTEALFVTVVNADRTRACADGVIPLEANSRPAIGFDGDALLVLEQMLRGTGTVPVLRRIAVDTDDCNWVPLRQ